MIVLLKIYATDKIFGKIYLKTLRDIFFSNTWSTISGGTGRLKILVRGDIQQNGKVETYGLAGRLPHLQFPALVGHHDLPIRKILRRVLGLFTVMILKRATESIYFQSNKFTACKIKDEKETLLWHSIY